MNRAEFLAQLRERLTGRMGEEELENALSYYEEYFADAGDGREDEVIEELVSPAAVAARLLEEGGEELPLDLPEPRRRNGPVLGGCIALGAVLLAVLAVLAASLRTGREAYVSGPPKATVEAPEKELVQRPTLPPLPTLPPVPTVPPVPTLPAVLPAETPGSTAYQGGGETKETVLEDFSSLDLDLGVGTVRVRKGERYGLSMSSSGVDKYGVPYELHYTLADGELSVWSTPESLSTEDGPQPGADVTITVPGGSALDGVKFSIGMGSLDWNGCAVTGRISGDVGMGDIDVSGPISGDADLETGMGNVSLSVELGREHFSYDLEAGMGAVRLDGEKLRGTSAEGGGGEASIELQSGMGDISLYFGG